ncbi:MAG: hypothetical protein QOF74_3098 [Caballeronia mineralivorans]|nr:hypothetical protein [Caballeronia mineralivorans]
MKMQHDHIVPLPQQALLVLNTLPQNASSNRRHFVGPPAQVVEPLQISYRTKLKSSSRISTREEAVSWRVETVRPEHRKNAMWRTIES